VTARRERQPSPAMQAIVAGNAVAVARGRNADLPFLAAYSSWPRFLPARAKHFVRLAR
jgi:hypothetical protein